MDYLSDYETYLRFEKESRDYSVKAYLADLTLFLKYLEVDRLSFIPSSVTKNDIRSWIMFMHENGSSARTINRRVTAVKGFFKWAYKEKLVECDPSVMVGRLKEKRYIPSFIREEEMEKILDSSSVCINDELSAEEKYLRVLSYTVIYTLYSTGLRRSELLQMKHTDVDLSMKVIKITGKGGKQRLIPLIPELESVLLLYTKEKKYFFDREINNFFVFLWSDGEPLNYYHLLSIVKDVLKAEGVQGKLSPHLLRHTFASHLLRAGAEITAIKELLGHSSLRTTQVYTHNTVEELKSVYMRAHPRAKDDKK